MDSDLKKLPNAGQVRAEIPSDTRQRSLLASLVTILPSLALYVGLYLAVVAAPWWAWLVLSPALGLAAGLLFVISHDAAHDALTPYHRLNGWLARFMFLPAWHPYTGWVHAHNHVHHGWTNYQPKDYVWSPLSFSQYAALSRPGKAWYRLFRIWPGFGFYYLYEVLYVKIWRIQPETKRRKTRLLWLADDLFVLTFVALHMALTIFLARQFGSSAHPIGLIFAAHIFPAILVNYLVGFITYLQHTHPSIPWFDNLDEWNFYTGQVLGTTHTRFPGQINGYIHNIMEHTAHHVDPRIPLYHLPRAQDKLAAEHHPVHHRFAWRTFRYTQDVCKLYDFVEHRWIDFEGAATSSRTISDEMLARARQSTVHSAASAPAAEMIRE